MANADLDRLIRWPDFYHQYLPDMKSAGANKMHGCCPFHHESNPSFWFNTENGMWKCETGCGQGNATQFLAKIANITTGEAYKRLCEFAGLDPDAAKESTTKGKVYTVAEYALSKRLPKEWLQSLGVREGFKGSCVEIPYKDEKGKITGVRRRMPPGSNPPFKWGKDTLLNLYGLWRLQAIRDAGYVILVEGESDTQTLWHLGLAGLGVPGANTFNATMAGYLLNIPTIYLHVEPDKAGRKMRRKVAQILLELGYEGTMKAFACAAHKGCKDPSALYLKEDADAARIVLDLAKDAKPVNLSQAALEDIEGMADAPIDLKLPPGYDMDSRGIYTIEKEVITEEPFCWTPLLITKFLPSVATGGIKIELAYMRDNRWHRAMVSRTTLANSRSIIELAERGVDVNSENGGKLVKFLSALERVNMDRIPTVQRISHYGWVDDTHFAPGAADEFVLDTEGSGRTACLGKAKGSYDAWKVTMNGYRQNSIFRFVFASHFAPALLRPLSQRTYMVHNWGGSKSGKTAAMYAGLSAWGDPEKQIVSFNATIVGLEKAAGFFCDLPLGVNERQLAGNKQGFIEGIVYMLSEGSGKLRGSKQGGLQEQTTWRSVIITSGEETLTVGTSQTGISTRALEIYGPPFANETEAKPVYSFVANNHGHAGPEFIRRLIEYDKANLLQMFEFIRSDLDKHTTGHSGTHIASVAVTCIADYLIDQWIFGSDEKTAMRGALAMGKEILGALETTVELDVNEKAYRYVLDWVLSNVDQFTDQYRNVRLGIAERDEPGQDGKKKPIHHMLIFPSLLEKELQKAGYSYAKTMRWMAEHEKIETRMRGSRMRCTIPRWVDGARVEMIRFTLPQEIVLDGFTEVDDTELPFVD